MAVMTLSVAGVLFDALDGSIALAVDGAPVAMLELPEDTAPELGPAEVLLAQGDDAPVTFSGTLLYAEALEGRTVVCWVGGAGTLGGGLGTAIHYTAVTQAVTVADVVADVVAGAGEQLDAGAAAALAGVTRERWTRAAGETWAAALSRALEGTGRGWRILDTGKVWVGVDTWPEAQLDGRVMDADLEARLLLIAWDRATLRPGTSLGGRHIVRVVFDADGRGEVEIDDDASGAAALARVLAPHQRTDPYAREWTGYVVTQHADGTLDLQVEDGAPWSDLLRVPFDVGVQGARYVLPGGAEVRIKFRRASPDGAIAFGRPHDGAASRGIARVRDVVNLGTLTLSTSSSLGPTGLLVAWVPPPAALLAGAQPIAQPLTLGADGQCQIALKGEIATASEEVLLR